MRDRSEQALPRRLAWPLALWLIVQFPAAAAEIVVEGACDLREAVWNANVPLPPESTDCTPGDETGTDTIILTGDVSFSIEDSSAPGNALLVQSQIVIEGNGYTISRDPLASDFRIFRIVDDGFLTDGDLTLKNTTVSGGRSPQGGGIYILEGTLRLTNSTISGNSTTAPNTGGGIENQAGTLTLTNSTISENSVPGLFSGSGGGISNRFGGTVSLTDSTVSGNSAYMGGGVFNCSYCELRLTDSTVSGNSAGHGGGGGIKNYGSAFLTNSTLSGNSTGHRGGGIDNYFGTLYLTNMTLYGNSAGNSGGGIYNKMGSAFLTNSIVYSLLLGGNCNGILTNGGNNFGCLGPPLTNLDTALADNGGPTLTHALLAGSNAIDAAGNCALLDPVLVADQRAAPRFDGNCDSGAFEFGGCPRLELMDDMVVTSEVYEECEIHVGPDFSVLGPGGDLTLTAGTQVVFFDGVEIGGTATIAIDPDLQITAALEAAARAGWQVP